MDWGFKKIPFTLYTYVLVAKILQNGAKSRYKKSWFQKLQEFEQLQTSSGKSKKLKFDGIFSKKKTTLQLKYYIQWIYVTLLSTAFV